MATGLQLHATPTPTTTFPPIPHQTICTDKTVVTNQALSGPVGRQDGHARLQVARRRWQGGRQRELQGPIPRPHGPVLQVQGRDFRRGAGRGAES